MPKDGFTVLGVSVVLGQPIAAIFPLLPARPTLLAMPLAASP